MHNNSEFQNLEQHVNKIDSYRVSAWRQVRAFDLSPVANATFKPPQRKDGQYGLQKSSIKIDIFLKGNKKNPVVQSSSITSTSILLDTVEEPVVLPTLSLVFIMLPFLASPSHSLTALLILFFWPLSSCPQTKCQCSLGLDSCPPLPLSAYSPGQTHPLPGHTCMSTPHLSSPNAWSTAFPLQSICLTATRVMFLKHISDHVTFPF